MAKMWIKLPGPGEFRGEGKWLSLDEYNNLDSIYNSDELEEWWHWCRENNYLPTAEQEEMPE